MKRIFLKLSTALLLANVAITAQAKMTHLTAKNHWYVSAGGGMEYPHFNAASRVNNGSGFTPPANQDIYSFQNNHHPFLTLSTGYRYAATRLWLPALSLGLNYQYLPSNDIGGHIVQYSDPTFTNYNFRWDITTQLLLAAAKLNLFQYHHLMPYVSAGMGAAYIRASSYHETALAGVTPRTSAGFAENTNTQFAYTLGAGLDYQINSTWLVSGGYQYLNLGKIRSGSGSAGWSGQSLYLGYYRSNELLINLIYLFS